MGKKDKEEKKTIKEWMELLPEPYRTEALANMWWEDKDNNYSTAAEALRQAFNWSRSAQGTVYWKDLCFTLKNRI